MKYTAPILFLFLSEKPANSTFNVPMLNKVMVETVKEQTGKLYPYHLLHEKRDL
jgi:hypothetical protein